MAVKNAMDLNNRSVIVSNLINKYTVKYIKTLKK